MFAALRTVSPHGPHQVHPANHAALIKVQPCNLPCLQLDKAANIAVARPKDALANRAASRSICPVLGRSARRRARIHARDRYTCLNSEFRKLSRSTTLSCGKRTALFAAHLDADGLAKYFTGMRQGSDVLTAYILTIAGEANWALPDEVRNRMRMGLGNFIQGKISRDSPLPTADLALRKLAAFAALGRTEPTPDPMWLTSITIEPNLWPTSAVLDWQRVLQRIPAMPIASGGSRKRSRFCAAGSISKEQSWAFPRSAATTSGG